MTELSNRPKILASDYKVIHKIKYMQFRRQAIPLLAVAACMTASFFLPPGYMLYPTLAAFFWFLMEKITFRTKHKIAVPEDINFVSPVDGKVKSIRKAEDVTIITINKSLLDVVELRQPYPGMNLENDENWSLDMPQGQVMVRLKSSRMRYFENKNVHGDVIGVVPGGAVITVLAPPAYNVLVVVGQNVFGGETELFTVSEQQEKAPERKSILVEEPFQAMIEEEK